ncbi:MAG: efflux RND transporter periplasmic adaptor subunit [Treponema sp.]|jgi:multidrug efflux pump subunit AcrA (membrane-fusion protein)|nr:efflux RND transporter periplasmic adaptor subunit [Treponema sp.]
MEKRRGGRVTIVLVCIILVVAALVIFQAAKIFSARGAPAPEQQVSPGGAGGEQSRQGGAGGQQARAAAVRTARVEFGSVENQVVLGGVVLAASEVPVYPVVGGRLTGLRVKIGDRIQQGDLIATVDPSKPGDSFFASPVTSPVSGTVLSVPVPVGDTVQASTAVCVVGDISRLRLETYVPERFSVNMRRGLPAQVRFEAMPGEYFSAEVDEMSPVLDPASRTRRIMLRFTNDSADPRIMAGMFASLSLVTNSRSGVPVIPRQSLINTYGSWIVFVVEDSGGRTVARRREVERGLESEEMVEILGGLEIGEMIVTEGQTFLSDGDSVRPVEEAGPGSVQTDGVAPAEGGGRTEPGAPASGAVAPGRTRPGTSE